MLLALIVAVDDLQEEAGQSDQFAVRSREEALQEAVTGFVKQDENGKRIVHLTQNVRPVSIFIVFVSNFTQNMTLSSSERPFSQHREASERPGGGRAEASPSGDPAPSGPSQSQSRSADAAGACGRASAAGLSHSSTEGVSDVEE